MDWTARKAARLVRAVHKASAKKSSFFGLFCIVFFAHVLAFSALGFLPEAPHAQAESPLVADAPTPAMRPSARAERTVAIAIPSIALRATVADPSTTNIDALDALLLHGAVRYPTSASLGEAGNVVLFGHSSYLPIVKNPAYQTFNGIQKLHEGDTIVVSSPDAAYTYAVRTVEKESAEDAAIPLTVPGRVLTLSTCDSFGKKSDRFVVTADFVESHSTTAS